MGMQRIDAHQHYWKLDRGDYGWIKPDNAVLYKDYLPDDLRPHRDRHGLTGSIVVQAASTLEETDYLLSLADRDESILGVVGYLDLDDPRCIEQYEACRKHPKYVGFRLTIQEMPDANAILRPHYVAALRYFETNEAPIDLLVKANQLDVLVRMMNEVPNLRGVIDHLAKPDIAKGELQPWEERMERLAAYPNLRCKLSGMVTEADHERWTAEQFVPYVRKVVDAFGTDRVIFGSDWPVCLLAASYDQVVDALQRSLPDGYSDRDAARLFGLNAMHFYQLSL